MTVRVRVTLSRARWAFHDGWMGGHYDGDVLKGDWRKPRPIPEVEAATELVVEDADSGFCGAVIGFESGAVVLEDRFGKRRLFPLRPAAFLIDGQPVTLRRPVSSAAPALARTAPARTASGSVAVAGVRARVARGSRIWVEGIHDAALVERIWGDDLRIEGVVVEPMSGLDHLSDLVNAFAPAPNRRLGVLVDHLVSGSKESRIVAGIRSPDVLITGHPYVDIWQAIRPTALGIAQWPVIPRGVPWKDGICAALGVCDPASMWRTVLAAVNTFADVETPLLTAMEQLIDFVTEPD